MNRTYLAGPMSGYENLNYPLFHAEAARLRALGYHIENPAENPECATWENYMRLAIAQLITCDQLALLPSWALSRGAVIERNLARSIGMRVVMSHELQVGPNHAHESMHIVAYA